MFKPLKIIHVPNLPAHIGKELILYAECQTDERTRAFVEEWYNQITTTYSAYGLKLIYSPKIVPEIDKKLLRYLFGGNVVLDTTRPCTCASMLPKQVTDMITGASLVWYRPEESSFVIAEFDLDNDNVPSCIELVGFPDIQDTITYRKQPLEERLRKAEEYIQNRHKKRLAQQPTSADGDGIRFSQEDTGGVRFSKESEPSEDLKRPLAFLPDFQQKLSPRGRFGEIDIPLPSVQQPTSHTELPRRQPTPTPVHTTESPSYDTEPWISTLLTPSYEEKAAEKFEADNNRMINAMAMLMDELQKRGYTREVILNLVDQKRLPALSPIVIMDGRILLKNNKSAELKLAPMDKAFYMLYLKHPEGINYKDMIDYKQELYDLYRSVSKRINFIRQRKTVESFCNPSANSMSISASRIKSAFLAIMDDSIARNYYIQGAQGQEKNIPLDRELVEWK